MEGGKKNSLGISLCRKETAPHPLRERVNPPLRWSPQPFQSPPPLFLHYCRPLLCQSLRIHNMAHFRKAYFDRKVGTNAVAAVRDEKQTVPCAKPGRRERKNNPGCLLHWP